MDIYIQDWDVGQPLHPIGFIYSGVCGQKAMEQKGVLVLGIRSGFRGSSLWGLAFGLQRVGISRGLAVAIGLRRVYLIIRESDGGLFAHTFTRSGCE